MSAPIDDRPAHPGATPEGDPVTADLEHPLVITVEAEGSETVLRLTGELDPHTAPLLQEDIDAVRSATGEATPATVVLELSGLTFIDSSGLRVVISAQKSLAADGGRLVLRGPSETARRLLEITGLVDHIAVEP